MNSTPDQLQAVADALRNGGVAVYPTETLYAIGCRGDSEEAVRNVSRLKARPEGKPLPLLVGSMDGLEKVCGPATDVAARLMNTFWPGPLSILVPAGAHLASGVSDERGLTSVRWTAHPVAARLSEVVGAPLVATSANRSGQPPAALPEELDTELLAGADAFYSGRPYPSGGAPSTVVEVLDDGSLRLVRVGAVSGRALLQEGFALERE